MKHETLLETLLLLLIESDPSSASSQPHRRRRFLRSHTSDRTELTVPKHVSFAFWGGGGWGSYRGGGGEVPLLPHANNVEQSHVHQPDQTLSTQSRRFALRSRERSTD